VRLRAREIPWSLLCTALCIGAVGLAFVWSSSYLSGPMGEGRRLPFFWRQAGWLGVGLAIFLLGIAVNYLHLRRYADLLYLVCLAVLVALLLFGKETRNVKRWIEIGPVNVQPSELMKIAFIVAMAKYLMHGRDMRDWTSLAGPFVLTLVPTVLILLQPNLGTSLIFVPTLFAMLFASGARVRHLLLTIGAGVASLPLLYIFVMSPYQRERITAFLRPESKPRTVGYQLIQSLVAVGSGGVFGKGFGQGTQNRLNFLPERHTDFIFAVIGEEWGFAGCILVLLLFLALILLCLGVADRTTEPFGRLLCVGVATMFGVQLLVNTGMTIGLTPITGLPMPFVSYGGSSLICSFAGLALVGNVSMRSVVVFLPARGA
jgi:rod shape determining protein RodA